jgi:hypothetical protein
MRRRDFRPARARIEKSLGDFQGVIRRRRESEVNVAGSARRRSSPNAFSRNGHVAPLFSAVNPGIRTTVKRMPNALSLLADAVLSAAAELRFELTAWTALCNGPNQGSRP